MYHFFQVLLFLQFLSLNISAEDVCEQPSEVIKQMPEIKGDIELKILNGTANGAAYVSIYNPTREVITLHKVSIAENVLDRVELHDHVSRKNDIGQEYMEMIEIPEMEIQPGGTLRLVPGGKHLMLMEMKSTLCAFKELTFTFKFRNVGGDSFEITQKASLKTTKRCESNN